MKFKIKSEVLKVFHTLVQYVFIWFSDQTNVYIFFPIIGLTERDV